MAAKVATPEHVFKFFRNCWERAHGFGGTLIPFSIPCAAFCRAISTSGPVSPAGSTRFASSSRATHSSHRSASHAA
jgi:hypothetical protein